MTVNEYKGALQICAAIFFERVHINDFKTIKNKKFPIVQLPTLVFN